jgi:hypothetical protein
MNDFRCKFLIDAPEFEPHQIHPEKFFIKQKIAKSSGGFRYLLISVLPQKKKSDQIKTLVLGTRLLKEIIYFIL